MINHTLYLPFIIIVLVYLKKTVTSKELSALNDQHSQLSKQIRTTPNVRVAGSSNKLDLTLQSPLMFVN